MMLELYHHGSSVCAAKVRLALAEKQLTWVSHYLDILRGDQFNPAYLKINPKAVVPTLVHDGTVVPESTVICEYVEEVFPEHPIYPTAAYQRAQVRVWSKAVDEELHPACSAITYIASHRHTILRSGTGSFEEFLHAASAEETAARTLKWQWIQQGLSAPGAGGKIRLYDGYLAKMEQALAQNDWLVGDRFSMADIAMTPYVNRLDALSMSGMWIHGRHPRVERWFERVKKRPTFTPALLDWMPAELSREMYENGQRSWPDIKALLKI
jgi:ganglioside-induced differentiation-associated protein 1